MDGCGALETRACSPHVTHLDTVRALHQTVVSLRTALEVSKNELKQLREKYQNHTHNKYEDTIEKLSIENHVLRRQIIIEKEKNEGDSNDIETSQLDIADPVSPAALPQLELPIITVEIESDEIYDKSVVIYEHVDVVQSETHSNRSNSIHSSAQSTKTEQCEENNTDNTIELLKVQNAIQNDDFVEDNTESSGKCIKVRTESESVKEERKDTKSSFKTKIELLSKFDISIKVKTGEGEDIISSATSETGSVVEYSGNTQHGEVRECRMSDVSLRTGARPELDVRVCVRSEDSVRLQAAAQAHQDVDSLSVKSMSEDDNSVFSENVGAAGGGARREAGAEGGGGAGEGSGDESEEVDDIELIFTTDESKDMSNLQEDLVSIREDETWAPSPTKSTPILVKYHTLDPDFKPRVEDQENSQHRPEAKVPLGAARTDCERPGILKSVNNKSDYGLNRAGRGRSADSLSGDYRGLSLDTTKSSSLELGSSADLLRADSADSLAPPRRAPPTFRVVGETDISRCGVSEEDLADSNMARRNTCPNPFQYRPSQQRGYGCQWGPFRAPAAGRARPAVRAPTHTLAARRESGAQTDLSALPPRWSSEGYLAHKVAARVSAVQTPAARASQARRVESAARAGAKSSDETRRALLSDIGFTSMVPELSRSADPVWAEAGAPPLALQATPLTNTSRYLSRGAPGPGWSGDRDGRFACSYLPTATRSAPKEYRSLWRSSLPDVRGAGAGAGRGVRSDTEDTDKLLLEADAMRQSIDNLHYPLPREGVSESTVYSEGALQGALSRPYIPTEPRHLRLGHAVKFIAPHGRISLGTVRYVGVAGASCAERVMVGVVVPAREAPAADNDGVCGGRRYFRTPPGHAAAFVPFAKVVMAWAN